MRLEEIIKQCVEENETLLWTEEDDSEAVAYRKIQVFFGLPGLSDILEQAGVSLEESKKLGKLFSIVDRVSTSPTRTEAFVAERKTTDDGIDAICVETMDGRRRWINKDLTEAFAFGRKYWIDEPEDCENMVFIEEKGEIAGIVMVLK